MRKILNLLKIITLSAIASNNIVACSESSSTDHLEKNKLNDIILEKNLGQISFEDNKVPSRSELLLAIKIKNPGAYLLTENDFGFKLGSPVLPTRAIIVGINNYQGEVILHYTKL